MRNREKENIESAIIELEHSWQDSPSYCSLHKSNSPSLSDKEVYILANEQGAIRLAYELLRSVTSEERDEKGFSRIELNELTQNGDYTIEYIKTSSDDAESSHSPEPPATWKDRLWTGSIISLLFFIAICFIWGLISIVKILYNVIKFSL